jgi:HEAT repeat protein
MTAILRSLKYITGISRSPLGFAVLIILALSIAGVLHTRQALGYDQDVQKLNRFVQTPRSNPAAMKTFREGRDLIEGEKWEQAAEKFNGFINEFPKDRDVDAALYWFAYALQKQGKKDEAAAPLLRLIKNFPSSSWRREAEAMLVVLGRGEAIQGALDRNNCEIKMLALQSLFQADEDRAINFVNEVLQSNAEAACPGIKAAAVSLLGSHGGARATPILLNLARQQGDLKLRLTAIRRLGEQNGDTIADELVKLYEADRTKEIRTQILRALSEMHSARAQAKLTEIARSSDDLDLRRVAVRYLGEQDDAASLDELIRLFDSDRTPEIRTQVLRALSERDDPKAQAKLLDVARKGETPELRIEAIRRIGDRGKGSYEDLLQLYNSETNQQIKESLIRAYSEIDDPRARAKLYEIARAAESLNLRLYAIRRLGDKNDEKTIDQLISLYDTEQDVQVKATLIRSFGDSSQKSAVRKLISIARDSQSVELRKLAVRMLGESKDPDALKFLEELLK